MLPSPLNVHVEPKTYGQLGLIIVGLCCSVAAWQAIQDHNRLFTEDYSSERSLFTGFMYRIDYDVEIDGNTSDRYRFSTPTENFERVLTEGEDRRKLSRVEDEIHSMVRYEDTIVFSFFMLLYVWLCWFILRKYPWEAPIRFLPFVASVPFIFSIWHAWSNLLESAEDVMMYLSRL